MATHSRILAWEIPGTEETGGLQSTEAQKIGHEWATGQQTDADVSKITALSLGEERASHLLRLTETTSGTRASSGSPGLQPPSFPVKSRKVGQSLWLRGPQEPSVTRDAPTSGSGSPLFAFSSAHDDHPGCQRGDGLGFCRPGREARRGGLTWSTPRSLPFQLAFVSASVSPSEEVSVATSTHSSSLLLCLLLLHQL